MKLDIIKKIPLILAQHAFLVMLIFILFYLVFAVFIFYQYVILVEINYGKNSLKNTQFEYNAYQKILEEWQTKDQIFQQSLLSKPLNPFQVNSINLNK